MLNALCFFDHKETFHSTEELSSTCPATQPLSLSTRLSFSCLCMLSLAYSFAKSYFPETKNSI